MFFVPEPKSRVYSDGRPMLKWLERLHKLHQGLLHSRQWRMGNALGKNGNLLRPGAKVPLAVDRMQEIFNEFEVWKQNIDAGAMSQDDIQKLLKWMQKLEKLLQSVLRSRRWKMGCFLGWTARTLLLRPHKTLAVERMQEIFNEFEDWKKQIYFDPSRQQRKTAFYLEQKLWGGFSQQALIDLKALKDDPDAKPRTRAYAAWAMARWHAVNDNYELVWDCLAFMRSLDHSGSDHKGRILLEVESLRRFGRSAEAVTILDEELKRREYDPDLCLAYANTYVSADNAMPGDQADKDRLAWINKVFISAGFEPLDKADSRRSLVIDNLAVPTAEPLTSKNLPKISIIVPVYNSQNTIAIALRGLLDQTWQNIEVLVIDDCSTDNTYEVICRFAEKDSRIKSLRHENNQGAYSARNTGLLHATGEYITTHDSDDWSHPQKLEAQALALGADAAKVASISYWARTTKALRFTGPWRPCPNLVIWNHSSFMFTREVLEKLGGWDRVRITGDTEYIWRTSAIFGKEAITKIHSRVPLSFSLHEEDSLTLHKSTHVKTSYFGLRLEYRESAWWWHHNARTGNLYLDPQSRKRPFPAPGIMLSKRRETETYDLVFMMDFSLQGGAFHSTLNYILAALQAEMSVAIFHWRRYDLDFGKPLNPTIRNLVAERRVDVLVPGQKINTKFLIISYPAVLQYKIDDVPNIDFDRLIIIVNQMASRFYSGNDEQYDPRKARSNLQELFGTEGFWVSISGLVHRLMLEDPRYPEPHKDIWIPLIDTKNWLQKPFSCRDGIRKYPIIGRHGRDHYTKWPSDPQSVYSAYLAEKPCEVRILGGARKAWEVTGAIPSNWRVFEFNSLDPQEFLKELDFFVHFPHEDYIEECGRSVVEAMAMGVPVILPPVFRETFGNSALYTDFHGVWETIQRLWSNEEEYRRWAEAGRKFVVSNCDWPQLSWRLKRFSSEHNVDSQLEGTSKEKFLQK